MVNVLVVKGILAGVVESINKYLSSFPNVSYLSYSSHLFTLFVFRS